MNGWSSRPGDDRWSDEPAWVYEITWEWEPTPGQRYPGDPGRRKAVQTPVYEAGGGEERPTGRAPASSRPGPPIRYARPEGPPGVSAVGRDGPGYPAPSTGLPARPREEPAWNRPVAIPERITDEARRRLPPPPSRPAADGRLPAAPDHPVPPDSYPAAFGNRPPGPERRSPGARPPTFDSPTPGLDRRTPDGRPPTYDSPTPGLDRRTPDGRPPAFDGRPPEQRRGGDPRSSGMYRGPEPSSPQPWAGGPGRPPVPPGGLPPAARGPAGDAAGQPGAGVYGSARPAPPDAFPAYPDARSAPGRAAPGRAPDAPFDLRPAPTDRGTPATARPAPQPIRVTPARPVSPPMPIFPSVPGQAGPAPRSAPPPSWDAPPTAVPGPMRPMSFPADRMSMPVVPHPGPGVVGQPPTDRVPAPDRPGGPIGGPYPAGHHPWSEVENTQPLPPAPAAGPDVHRPFAGSDVPVTAPPAGGRVEPDRWPGDAPSGGFRAAPEPTFDIDVSWADWVWNRTAPTSTSTPAAADLGSAPAASPPSGPPTAAPAGQDRAAEPGAGEPHGLGWLLSQTGLGQVSAVPAPIVEPEATPNPPRTPKPPTLEPSRPEPPAAPAPAAPERPITAVLTPQGWFAPPAEPEPTALAPEAPAAGPEATEARGAGEVETVDGELVDPATGDSGRPASPVGNVDDVGPVDVDVVEAEIVEAEILDADVVEAQTPDADIIEAETPDADIVEAEIVDADIVEAEILDADAIKAETPDADATNAETPDADATKAETPDADATKAETPDADATKAETSDAEIVDLHAPPDRGQQVSTGQTSEEGVSDGANGGAEPVGTASDAADPASSEPDVGRPRPAEATRAEGETAHPIADQPATAEAASTHGLSTEAAVVKTLQAPQPVTTTTAAAQPTSDEPATDPIAIMPDPAGSITTGSRAAMPTTTDPPAAEPIAAEPEAVAELATREAGVPPDEPTRPTPTAGEPGAPRTPARTEPSDRPVAPASGNDRPNLDTTPASPVRGPIRQRRTPIPESDRRRQDPEQVLAAYPLVFDPATLREEADGSDHLWVLADRLSDKLEYAERDSVRARLLSLRAVVYRLVGDLDAALADGRAALGHARAAAELRLVSAVRARLAQVLQWRGEYAEADRLYTEANSPELPARLRAEIHELAGRSAFEQGRYLEAVNHFEGALDLRNGGDPEMVERIELALDVITRRGATGWGPYPRGRAEILGQPEPPRPARDDRTGLWGYPGVLPPRYAQAQPYAEGVAWVRRPDARAWELVDETGRLLVDASAGYLAAGRFAEGLAWVAREQPGGWFAIDRQNRVILPGGFDDARPFQHGAALIRRGGWGAIDRHGRVLVQPRYRAFATVLASGAPVDGFTEEGLAVVDAGDRFGVVDRAGQLLVAPVHAAVRIHPAAFLVADKYGLWGALDRRGEPLVELKYREIAGALDELDRRSPDPRPVL